MANSAAGRPRHRGGRPAFTLLELLAVMAIFAIMAALVGASSNHVRRYRIKSEAEELSSLLRSARQYAVENATHTRVVFADAAIEELTEGEYSAGRAYGAYAFFKPTLPAGGSDYKPFSAEAGHTLEFASMPFVSIPSGFVGEFIPLPTAEAWRTLDNRVAMEAYVPDDVSIETGYKRDFLDEDNPLATLGGVGGPESHRYLSGYFYNPATFWDPDGRAYYLPNTPNSQYPRNYFQTPYPRAYPLRSSRSMPSEPSTFSIGGSALTYDLMWSDQAEFKFFHEVDAHAGSYRQLGLPDSSSMPVERRRFFDLKGVEFSPKGLPTFGWTEEVVFRFSYPDTPVPAYEVTIDRITGLANVRLAVPPAPETADSP